MFVCAAHIHVCLSTCVHVYTCGVYVCACVCALVCVCICACLVLYLCGIQYVHVKGGGSVVLLVDEDNVGEPHSSRGDADFIDVVVFRRVPG